VCSVLVLVFVVYNRRREAQIKYPGPEDDVRKETSQSINQSASHNYLILETTSLKGLCQEMHNFLKAYYDKNVFSVHALIVFTIFCFLRYLNEKNQTQSFSLLLCNYLQI
jgi:predicted dinucleotide-utilizing enzyme